MFTTSPSKTFAFGLLTTAALFTACEMGGQAPADDSGEQALLRLGEALNTGSALDRIGARFQMLDAAEIGLSENPLGPEDARARRGRDQRGPAQRAGGYGHPVGPRDGLSFVGVQREVSLCATLGVRIFRGWTRHPIRGGSPSSTCDP